MKRARPASAGGRDARSPAAPSRAPGSAPRGGRGRGGGRGGSRGGGPIRSKRLEEDVVLPGSKGGDDAFAMSDSVDSAEDSENDSRGPEEARESLDAARLRVAKEYLERLTRVAKAKGRGSDASDDDGGDDDEGVDAGAGESSASAADVHARVGAALHDGVLASAGALFRPLASKLAGHTCAPGDAVFVRGHQVGCVCSSSWGTPCLPPFCPCHCAALGNVRRRGARRLHRLHGIEGLHAGALGPALASG